MSEELVQAAGDPYEVGIRAILDAAIGSPASDDREDAISVLKRLFVPRLAALRERPAVGVVAERGEPMSLEALEAAREAWRVGHQKPDMFAGFLTDLHDRGFTIRAALSPTPQDRTP